MTSHVYDNDEEDDGYDSAGTQEENLHASAVKILVVRYYMPFQITLAKLLTYKLEITAWNIFILADLTFAVIRSQCTHFHMPLTSGLKAKRLLTFEA